MALVSRFYNNSSISTGALVTTGILSSDYYNCYHDYHTQSIINNSIGYPEPAVPKVKKGKTFEEKLQIEIDGWLSDFN